MWTRILLATAIAACIYGQTITTGEITGTVIDSSGGVVSGAAVRLKNLETGETRSAESGAAGLYRFALVKPGNYEISGSSAGLKSDIGRLVAAVGQVQAVNLTLKLEEVKEVVLVTDSTPALQTDNANSTYTLSARQLELLPLAGGDLVSVAYSMPGAIVNSRYGTGSFASQGIGSVSNLFTVNGVDNMDPYYNTNNYGVSGLLLGANEIREVSMVQNAYEGQYGRQAGTQVNYVSKSGANAFHGNLAETYNGNLLNANDFFSNQVGLPRPHEVSNQYAAALGGRIVRDKLFFFADTEGLRYALPSFTSPAAIPTPEFEAYTLRTIEPSQVPLYQQMFNLYNNAPGHERAVPVTTGNGAFQDNFGQLGCGASFAGTPTGTGGIFGNDVPCERVWAQDQADQLSEWLLSTRIDYNLSSKQRLFFRFKTDHGLSLSNANLVNQAFTTQNTNPDYEGQVNYTFILSPHLVNNFIGSVNYNDFVTSFSDLAKGLAALPIRVNFIERTGNDGFRFENIGPPAAYPSGRRAGQFQIVDDVSYNPGRHSFKAGLNYRYNREADLQYSALLAIPRFGLNMSDFASGVVSSGNFSQYFTAHPVIHLHLYNAGVYIQDQWTVSQHLKVTADIRFDRTGNPYCVERCFSRLNSPFPQLNKGLSIPYNQSIQAGLEQALYAADAAVPQPRFAAVYSPAWSPKTVIRGGIGLFSDLYPAFFAGTMAGNPPDVYSVFLTNGLVNSGGPGSAPAIATASANAFRTQFAGGATLAQLQQAVAPVGFGPPGFYSLPAVVHSPRYLKWSLDLQHQFGARNVITLQYTGNHGYDLFLLNPNLNSSGFAGLPAQPPDPRFKGITQLTNSGFSNYDGLSAIFRRAFGRGFQGQIGYTWSHALDTISNGGLGNSTAFGYTSLYSQINPFDVRDLTYGSSDYDVRHNVTADFIWEIPANFKAHPLQAILSGWAVAGKLTSHTAMPFSVTNSNTGFVAMADLADPRIQTSCGHSAIDNPCFTPSQFVPSRAQRDFGNLSRNSFRGPGFSEMDASVYKTFHAAERLRLTLGASAFNLLNRVNLDNPNSDLARPGLGLIQGTVSGPSGPYGSYAGPASRTVVLTGKFAF